MDPTSLFTLSYGIYLIASQQGECRAGCLVNTVFQITAEPIGVAVSVSKVNQTHDIIEQSGKLSVAVMAQSAPVGLLGRFGYRSGRDFNKFEGFEWHENELGVPVVDTGAIAQMSCEVTGSQDCQTHTVFFCRVVEAKRCDDGEPMTYQYYRDVVKGKSSKNAPTYSAAKA